LNLQSLDPLNYGALARLVTIFREFVGGAAMAEPERTESRNGAASFRADSNNNHGDDAVVGSPAIRPVFLGNLMPDYTLDDITRMFENSSSNLPPLNREYRPFYVDHIDQKRGYCFVFLKDAPSQSYKNDIEDFVEAINGM
jgi:RNA recognition motif-containing protein